MKDKQIKYVINYERIYKSTPRCLKKEMRKIILQAEFRGLRIE